MPPQHSPTSAPKTSPFPPRIKLDITGVMAKPRLRPATRADLPRMHQVRHGTAENRLTNPALVTGAEVAWYMGEAIFLVSEDETGVQGFTCVNHQTGYVWALFVIDGAQGRGHGTALLNAAMARLRQAGHRQAFLTTGPGTKAQAFYRSKGWQPTGVNLDGDAVFRLWL
jgi:GNAT superfamily N-acetyltransferase